MTIGRDSLGFEDIDEFWDAEGRSPKCSRKIFVGITLLTHIYLIRLEHPRGIGNVAEPVTDVTSTLAYVSLK